MKRSTILHLRFPFSLFLLPVFLFAMAASKAEVDFDFGIVFVILHFLIYPASNGFNSYFDKDEGSIGGLERPPKVTKELYFVATIMDIVAIALSFFISPIFALMILMYIGVSRAYSHPAVRLKKYPIIGWLVTGIFQGYFTFLLVIVGLTGINPWDVPNNFHLAGAISSLLLFGSYPMTQIYQHDEDEKRGDITISLLLGIRGTFHFTAALFSIATAGFIGYFLTFHSMGLAVIYAICSGPVLTYFLWWYLRMRENPDSVNFKNTMRLNALSSLAFSAFFILWWLKF